MAYKDLIKAFEFAEKFRFTYDIASDTFDLEKEVLKHLETDRSHSSLIINEKVTPQIYLVLHKVCKKLRLNSNNVSAYIYSSSDNQATCFLGEKDKCTIMITSNLIELMDENELEFIIGHEIGHFLLKHGTVTHSSKMSKEDLIYSRYKEISADRIGLIASGTIESALSSIVKMLSGLSSAYLRYDISALMQQINNVHKGTYLSSESTHPSWLIRVRALQFFSMSEMYNKEILETNNNLGDPIERVDELIYNDLESFIDKPIRKEIEDSKKDLSFWIHIFAVLDDDKFDKKEQEIIKQEFGEKQLNKIKKILTSSNKEQSRNFINSLLEEKISGLAHIAPKESQIFYRNEINNAERKLNIENLESKIVLSIKKIK